MNRGRAALRLLVLITCSASVAHAGSFTPISPTVTGTAYVNAANNLFGGSAAQEPQLACYVTPTQLPTLIQKGKLLYCHGCAPTNPCTAGAYDLLALGVCNDGSDVCDTVANPAVGQWQCLQGFRAGPLNALDKALTAFIDMPEDGSAGTIAPFSFPWGLSSSPSRSWHVTYDATLLVLLGTGGGPPDECDFQLLVNGAAWQTAAVWVPSGSTSILTQVRLHYEADVPDSALQIRFQLAGLATTGDHCRVQSAAGLLPGPGSRMQFSAVPN